MWLLSSAEVKIATAESREIGGADTPPLPEPAVLSALAARVAMAVLIQVARLVPWMIVMLTRHFLPASLVAVPMLVKIAGRVPGVIVMLTGNLLLPSLVAMAVLIQIARLVSRMIVMLPRLFLRHVCSP